MRQKKSNSFSLSWNVNFSAPRIAISLIDSSVSESYRTSVSFVLYDVKGAFQQGELHDDETLTLRITAVRLFGNQGSCLLAIGMYSAVWYLVSYVLQ